MKRVARLALALVTCVALSLSASAQTAQRQIATPDYPLGPGDVVRITVFQNPDLTTETRVSEQGYITFPLIGNLLVKGVPIPELERVVAQRLRDGSFVKEPQVNAVILQFKSIRVSVLGQVNHPGKFYLERPGNRLSEVLALAGGITPLGHDVVTLVKQGPNGESRTQVDVHDIFLKGDGTKDVSLSSGDAIYVPRYPVFYIYGEVNRPGQYRVERGMTVQQALAVGGGPTVRGTQRGMQLTRKSESSVPVSREADPAETVWPDDVIFVKESFF
jgi:polysaccharide export outer membrane protein